MYPSLTLQRNLNSVIGVKHYLLINYSKEALEASLSVSSATVAKADILEAQHRGRQAEDDPFVSLPNVCCCTTKAGRSTKEEQTQCNDMILDIFVANVESKAEEVKTQPNAAQHRGKQAEDDPFASLDVHSNQMFTVQPQLKPKHDAMQSGDDVILGMFSSDPAHNTSHNFIVYPCDLSRFFIL
eukprot:550884_1